MKHLGAFFAGAVLLSSLCVAQDLSPAGGDTDSGQNVVAAARASKVQASIAADKEADIRRLLALMGSGALATQAMDEMEKSIRPLMTGSLPPGEYRDKLVELFFQKFHEKRDPAKLLDLMVPIYDKYYSDADLKGLIQFYQTPLGQKTVTALPSLMVELTEAGQQLGQEAGRVSMLEVLAEHPELEKAMEDAQAQK